MWRNLGIIGTKKKPVWAVPRERCGAKTSFSWKRQRTDGLDGEAHRKGDLYTRGFSWNWECGDATEKGVKEKQRCPGTPMITRDLHQKA